MGFEEKFSKGLDRARKEADVRRVEFNQARYAWRIRHREKYVSDATHPITLVTER